MNEKAPIRRPRVVFVGGFNDSGVKGGQVFASRSIINSPLGQLWSWTLVDSTMPEVPPPPFWKRAMGALRRLIVFARALSTRPSLVIIFASTGASFVEKTLMASLARLVGAPVAFCPRSGLIIGMAEKSALGRFVIRVAARCSSILICQGKAWANFYTSIAPSARTEVIPNFIDEKPYLVVRQKPTAHPPLILFLGSIETNKGIYDLVAAADILVGQGRSFHLCMGGEGGEMARLRQRVSNAAARDSITLLGWVRQVEKIDLMGRATALVLPSYREGFPNVILEAMASARPVVASSVGAVPELIHDGVTGYLTEPGDPRGLAHSLARLIDHPDEAMSMGLCGRLRALEGYSADIQWKRWHDVLAPLIEKNE